MGRTSVISPSGRVAICGAALAIVSLVGRSFAAEPGGGAATEGANGVLVLRNGNVLPGLVTKLSGYYRIELAGSSFRVPADQVEISCGTIAEAYEIRRSHRAGWSADSHVDLATWCLRNNLPDQAREILDVRTTDPSNPALSALETQLKQAFDGRSRANDTTTKASATSAGSAERMVNLDEALEDGDLPDVDVTEQVQFVRNIQPMLIHSCATGGCHAASAAEPMRLDRWALDGGGNPTLVRRNLAEVLAQIDSEHPDESPLLRHGHVTHGQGKAPRPSLPLDARQTAILKFWIDEVCGVDLEAPATPTVDGNVQPVAAEVDDPIDEFDPAEFNEQ